MGDEIYVVICDKVGEAAFQASRDEMLELIKKQRQLYADAGGKEVVNIKPLSGTGRLHVWELPNMEAWLKVRDSDAFRDASRYFPKTFFRIGTKAKPVV